MGKAKSDADFGSVSGAETGVGRRCGTQPEIRVGFRIVFGVQKRMGGCNGA